MATLPIHNAAGEKVGSYEIDTESIANRVNKQLLHDVVVMYQANARQGSRAAKTRGEVSGSTKKMYRQKGTGNARAGSKRTNIRRGGGVAHTIKPRDYSYRLPKKAIKLATRMAIRSKIDDGEVVVIDELSMQSPKTKQLAGVLKALGLDETTTLMAIGGDDQVVYRSGRNIQGLEIQPVRQLNALSVLKPKRMLVTREALDKIKDGSFAGTLDVVAKGPSKTSSRVQTAAKVAGGVAAAAGVVAAGAAIFKALSGDKAAAAEPKADDQEPIVVAETTTETVPVKAEPDVQAMETEVTITEKPIDETKLEKE